MDTGPHVPMPSDPSILLQDHVENVPSDFIEGLSFQMEPNVADAMSISGDS